jgi:hypothetical protein
MFVKIVIITILLLTVSTWATAVNNVILIGGGPYPDESQVSIENNTKWIIKNIKSHTSARISKVLFTDGNSPGVDVYKIIPNNSKILLYEPLARVYGKQLQNSEVYYSSNIDRNDGPATHASVVNAIKSGINALGEKDALFLIFQGHGNYNSKNINANYFYLWNDGKLTVSELGKLISKAPQNSTIRFLFPQCFSGAFTNLMYKNQSARNGLIRANICGFTAQRNDLPSEGCTPSIDKESYRDYSTYMFSALFGKTIDGRPLSANPDINHEGTVTLREAHLYTLGHAISIDYSRSTSEDYLQNWLPWYLKWIPDSSVPDNVYMKIANTIASKYKLKDKSNSLIHNVANMMRQLDTELDTNRKTRHKLETDIKHIQSSIRQELSRRWPQLDTPYTTQYNQLLNTNINEISSFIEHHKYYSELATKQNKVEELQSEALDTRRKLTQVYKILRMMKLARTLQLFKKYASDTEKAEYSRLVTCEDAKL